ncbi:fasciclin domain-containing protein [Streptomyces sp. ZYX-F-203]|uniref:fasciclin domain-containing protein n=1 Tax=Streptomyces sp. HSG2 TaxID=2797167 RepID=UPI001907F855|nr:fasciclin domain-containing protein [Streptomyces sp. HSG2]
MNSPRVRRHAVALATAALLPLALAACGSEDGSESAADKAGSASAERESSPARSAAAGEGPFGPACASVPQDGAGSFDGMAQDPVATAASNNPALSTLVTAVEKAGLVDTLNNAEDITVFAPTNDAFEKIPAADLEKVLNDEEALTDILTYHVVGERLTPRQLESGSFETLQKGMVTTAGSGESYTVNDTATVVCGSVTTANATVHIIDTVLMPN